MLYQHDLATVLDAERVLATIDGEPLATHRTTREWLGVGLIRTGIRVLGSRVVVSGL